MALPANTVDELLNQVEAMFACGAARPSELARHMNVAPQRVTEWIKERKWRPSGLATLSIFNFAASVTVRISSAGRKMQSEYRKCYREVCERRPVNGKD